MPIRLCQKCGLKVLIDESQAGTNPFYCQRCTTAMKGQENAPAPSPAMSRNPTPSPMASRSEPAAPSVGAAKAATVRVLCPYCKASFNGRVPQKPARGSCPVCQKELILLPNGDIKPAAGFDLGSWQNEPAGKSPEPSPAPEPAAEPKESGTRLLVKKYAAEPAKPPPKREPEPEPAPVAPSADTDPSDEGNPLPGWLDDTNRSGGSGGMVQAPPETDSVDVVEPKKEEYEDRTVKVEDEPPPAASPPRARPAAAKLPNLSGKPAPPPPPPALAPEPEVDLLPPDPPPAPKKVGRMTERRLSPAAAAAPAVAVAESGETGSGKVFLALILALLPIAACAGLLTSRDKLKHDLVKKIGARFVKGFGVLHLKVFPPPPPPKPVIEEKKPEVPEPPKEAPPKPDPDQQRKDEQKISHIFNETLMMKRNLKQLKKTETPDQAAGIQKIQDEINKNDARVQQLRQDYQRMYGKDYDPEKQ